MYDLYIYLYVFLFGTIVGSFLNVCIYRIPKGLSIVWPSSRCISCNNPIRPLDNIPILSYILLKGRCRMCREKISFKYPFVEFLNGLLYVLILWRFDSELSLYILFYFVFLSSLVVITFIDLEYQIIPNGITLPGIPLALIAGSTILPDPFFRDDMLGFQASITGLLLGGGFYYCIAVVGSLIFKKEAMGGGDIKMMAMAGGVLGWKGVILTTMLGSLFGSIIGIFLIIVKGRQWGSRLPFGPYLALGCVISLFLGQEVFMWYLYSP